MHFNWDYVKHHKALIIGGIVVGAIFLYVIWRAQSSNSGGAVQQGGIDPNAAALAGQQAQLSSNENIAGIQAGVALQTAQLSQTQNLAQISAQKEVSLADIGAGHDVSLAKIAADIQNSHDVLAGNYATLQTQLEIVNSNNATNQALAQIVANENVGIAQTNAGVLTAQIAGMRDIAIKQSDSDVQKNFNDNLARWAMNKDNTSVLKSQSGGGFGQILGAVGGIVGALL